MASTNATAAGGTVACPAHTIASGKACLLSNPSAPPEDVADAVRTEAVAAARAQGALTSCVWTGNSGRRTGYQCIVYSLGGSTYTAVNGKVMAVTLLATFSVAHDGCIYAVGSAAGPAVIVANGCGTAGLGRVKAALSPAG